VSIKENILNILNDSKYFFFEKHEKDLLNLVELIKNAKNLMEYLKKLEEDKIRLEDLIDVIDDTSEETDALVQEMMEVRNAFYHITFDDNVPLDTNG
jgi:hypothetical protein